MTSPVLSAAAIAVAGVIGLCGTGLLIPLLRRAAILDNPNARSSHVVPTPRGGGIAVIAGIVCAWLMLIATGAAAPHLLLVLGGTVLLAGISWRDDRRSVSPVIRLATQVVAVMLGMTVVSPAGMVLQGALPGWLDTIVAAMAWVWFVNLFNFMDGIDGIAGSEAAAISVGLVLLAIFGTADAIPGLPALSGVIAAATLGFLVWNWAPARIFLGDVGSVPLGYLLGFLLLTVAAHGAWKIALILPLYFLADATLTLLRRLARGERVWQAHREHLYQQAVQRGFGHHAVVRRVIAADIGLIACGLAAEHGWGTIGLVAAATVVLALLASLAAEHPA
ncbi:MAG TPA: glycosyltransferase family 4 protein [Stellaceae bacterium]|jgi:UDP-N-acetylmuramyl pentapeptide phosphotransferase/UDP-N-acetylglucosamine-1-phosphate transferase|nr:glycosyltransferase family 4 protein [Stellaceae bacterium]